MVIRSQKRRFPKPLNPSLYDFLWNEFGGDVRVSKPGQQFRYTVSHENGETVIDPVPGGGGEEYQVNCPLCGDKRRRLYINHRYGTTVLGAEVWHLAHCFNESCAVNPWLRERMNDASLGIVALRAPAAEAADPDDTEAVAAEAAANHDKVTAVPVDMLPPEHPAACYLDGRGFDRRWLYDRFRVGFHEAGGSRRLVNRRIVAPVFYGGTLVGWSARAIPGYTRLTPGDPGKSWPYREGKYVNSAGMPKSQFVYNIDLARQHDVIAVVEGVTDVWRVGEWGAGLLGKKMSAAQRRLLCRVAEPRGAWLVLFGDADAAADWRDNRDALLRAYVHADRVRLHLFRKGDPGDRTSKELCDLATELINDGVVGD